MSDEKDCECERKTWADAIGDQVGLAIWFLVVCLGLSTCSVADSYTKKLDAQTAAIKAGAKP